MSKVDCEEADVEEASRPLLRLDVAPHFSVLHKLQDSLPRISSFQFSGVTVPDAKHHKELLLADCHGHTHPDHVLAVFGPSPRAHTALLNVLAGRRHAVRQLRPGASFTCTTTSTDSIDLFSVLRSGLVPAELHHNPTSTVEEELRFACALRLPASAVGAATALVNELISSLGLDDRRHVQLRRLTKAELRRVAIAVELCSLPNVLLVDQPVDGASRKEDWQTVRILQQLQQQGVCRVVCAVAVPRDEVFQMLSPHFVLLGGAGGGSTLCVGDAAVAQAHFAAQGLANTEHLSLGDYFLLYAQYANDAAFSLIKVSSSAPSATKQQGVDEALPQLQDIDHTAPPSHAKLFFPVRSVPVQLWWLFKRELRAVARQPGALVQRAVLTSVIMGLCSVMFSGAGNQQLPTYTPAGHFSSFVFPILSLSMTNTMSVAQQMNQFKHIALREHGAYRLLPALLVKFAFEVVLLFAFVAYAMAILYDNIGWGGGFAMLTLTFFAMVESVMSYAYLFAFACDDAGKATGLTAMSILPQMFMLGTFARFNVMPGWLSWLNYTCNLTYAMKALATLEFNPESCHTAQICTDQRLVLESNYIDREFIVYDYVLLVVFFVVYRALACVLFMRKLDGVR